MNPEDINREVILAGLAAHNNPLLPSQRAVCLPWIKRYFKLMSMGHNLRELKINSDRNAIADGHHRYICHILLNTVPEVIDNYPIPDANVIIAWENVIIDDFDWGGGYGAEYSVY